MKALRERLPSGEQRLALCRVQTVIWIQLRPETTISLWRQRHVRLRIEPLTLAGMLRDLRLSDRTSRHRYFPSSAPTDRHTGQSLAW
jgi:hypothetical protein